jgi:hypothetical protein
MDMRRFALVSLLAVMAFAGCGSSGATQAAGGGGAALAASSQKQAATPAQNPSSGAQGQASGGGSFTVNIGGSTYTVKGGDCAPGIGGGYFVAEAGDWIDGNDPSATADFVSIMIYPDGHAEHGGGIVSGIKFYLDGSDEKGTGDATSGGTFSGTDTYGHGAVSGTFTCS